MTRSRQCWRPLNYRNLDDVPEFKGRNTTTEFLTKHIFDQLAKGARAGELGREGRELKAIRVTLLRVACRARLVRGAICGEAFRLRGAGRSCDPDRRLCL